MCCLNSCFIRVSEWFQGRFKVLGEFIGSNPVVLISISLFVCIGLSIGMLRLSMEQNTETLYTPVGSRASKDRVKLQDVFPDRTGMNYIQHALTTPDVYGDVIFSASNVLANAPLAEVKQHVELIKNISVAYNDTVFTYSDICAMLNDQCAISGDFVITESFSTGLVAGSVTYPKWNNADISRTFGNTNSSGGYLVSAAYVRIIFHLRQHSDLYQILTKAWEDEFIKAMANLKTEQVSVFYASSQSLDKELNANTGGDIKFFSITFTLMITYATVVAGGDMVSSRTWASWAGVLAAGMGTLTSFGLVSACGMKFVNIVGVTPFLVIGIGVDDMFLLMSSWAETYGEEADNLSYSERRKRVKERMGRTFASAGIGITITSLTDLLAFVIGASSIFISVRNFCVYTGVAVIFCYLYQCFFFSPCLALHGHRVAAKRHCITCLKVKSRKAYRDEGKSFCFVCCCGGKPPTERGDDERVCETLPRKWLPIILLNILGKILVMLSFLAYISVSIWGTYNLRQGLDLKNLVSKSSHYYSYADVTNTHFDSSFPIPFIFEASTDYLNSDTVSSINKLLTAAGSDTEVNNASQICWLFAYTNSGTYNDTNISTFITNLKGFLAAVPTFRNDVEFSSDDLGIKGSRCYLFSTNIKDSNLQAAVMTRMRTLADNSPLSVYVYHPAFIYFEQYLTILSSTLQTVGVALAVMTLVTFIFLPDPLLVLLVVVNIVSIIVGIFGFLYFWDLSLSSITMIHLIMSVGFSVDFSVHVCSAFMLDDGKTRHEKAQSAIIHAAGPILNGGLSSFLGIIVLVFSESYVFQSFFKIMFTVILFGMLHAVFLLPVVLSVIGPMGCPAKQVSQRKSTSRERIGNLELSNGKYSRRASGQEAGTTAGEKVEMYEIAGDTYVMGNKDGLATFNEKTCRGNGISPKATGEKRQGGTTETIPKERLQNEVQKCEQLDGKEKNTVSVDAGYGRVIPSDTIQHTVNEAETENQNEPITDVRSEPQLSSHSNEKQEQTENTNTQREVKKQNWGSQTSFQEKDAGSSSSIRI